MLVHFVCLGNTYHSRLAEAYLKSLKIPGVKVISSGLVADEDENGPITNYAKLLQKEYGLDRFGKPGWTQLTQSLLDESTIVICMNREIYAGCKARYKLPLRTFIWDIPDVKRLLPKDWQAIQAGGVPAIAETTFRKICTRVDELVQLIRKPVSKDKIEVLDFAGQPLDKTANTDTIFQKGLWHAGVHGVLYTDTKKVLVEKRSETIIYGPGLLDISFGGIVDFGEEPVKALAREAHEELGIIIEPSNISEIGVVRYDHYLTHYGLHSRVFLHSYIIKINQAAKLSLQASEVSEAFWITLKEAYQLVRSGSSDNGEAQHYRKYMKWLLDAVQTAS